MKVVDTFKTHPAKHITVLKDGFLTAKCRSRWNLSRKGYGEAMKDYLTILTVLMIAVEAVVVAVRWVL